MHKAKFGRYPTKNRLSLGFKAKSSGLQRSCSSSRIELQTAPSMRKARTAKMKPAVQQLKSPRGR